MFTSPAEEAGGYQRLSSPYTPLYQRFLVREKKFTQQYSHIYARRLDAVRPALRVTCTEAWGGADLCARIIDAKPGMTVSVIGTLYKDMALKPNILDEFSAERQVSAPPARANYCSAGDSLVLEDDSGRIALAGVSRLVGHFVSGIVLGVRGRVVDSGDLVVTDIRTFRAPAPPRPLPSAGAAPLVLLVSGLHFGGSSFNPLATLMLGEFITGNLGGPRELSASGRIVRVVVCGGLLDLPSDCFADKLLSAANQTSVTEAMTACDVFLAQIASAVAVDVMPGEKDPSNFTLPQQPLHRCLLSRAARYNSFRPVTNPYEADVEGLRLLGTSGQCVADVQRYTSVSCLDITTPAPTLDYVTALGDGPVPEPDIQSEMACLRSLLDWGHLAPTAPDTLACYPFYESDPFVLTERPHVFFSGNAHSYQSLELAGESNTRLIAVPAFSSTGTAVLMDLHTLKCEAVQFCGQVTQAAADMEDD